MASIQQVELCDDVIFPEKGNYCIVLLSVVVPVYILLYCVVVPAYVFEVCGFLFLLCMIIHVWRVSVFIYTLKDQLLTALVLIALVILQ